MITLTMQRQWRLPDGGESAAIYGLTTDAAYSPDVVDDMSAHLTRMAARDQSFDYGDDDTEDDEDSFPYTIENMEEYEAAYDSSDEDD